MHELMEAGAVIRSNQDGRYCLNDLHQATVAEKVAA
jgi:hypothetical protein